ncbi:MAG TPA: hypothetical protein VKR58_08065 [Aquella sp.]|nr:hypothetical protein [Aquella sp.]
MQYLDKTGAKFLVNEISTCYVRIPEPMDKDLGCNIKQWLQVETKVGTVGMRKIAKIGVNNLFELTTLKKIPRIFKGHEALTNFEGNIQSNEGTEITYKAQEENNIPGYKFYFFDKKTGKWVKALKFCEIVLNYKTDDEISVYPPDEPEDMFEYYRDSYKDMGCKNIALHSLKTANN